MHEMRLKKRNPLVAAWLTYPRLRKIGHLSRWTCLRLALSHFWSAPGQGCATGKEGQR